MTQQQIVDCMPSFRKKVVEKKYCLVWSNELYNIHKMPDYFLVLHRYTFSGVVQKDMCSAEQTVSILMKKELTKTIINV